jgi:hypothetical protein
MFGINGLRRLLKFTYGPVITLVGVDKFFGFLTDWTQYVSPLITDTIGMDAGAFLGLVGVIEVALGILLMTKWERSAAYGVAGFGLLSALNLISTGQFYDIALRYLLMIVGVVVLANLSSLKTAVPKTISGETPEPIDKKASV